MAGHAEDVRARVVAVSLLVRADTELRDVRVHRAVSQRELDVTTASAALLPLRKLEAREIRDKVRLPLMAPWLDSPELALARKSNDHRRRGLRTRERCRR